MPTKIRLFLSIVFLDGMVMGIVIPAMPLLVADLEQSSVAGIVTWGGLLTAAFGLAQFLVSPLLGALSDAIGRRRVLLIALLAMAVEFVILLFAPSVWLLLLARVVGGAGSANRGVISAAIADSFTDEARARAMGSQTAAFAAGLVFGPTLGSLALLFGPMLPFVAALVLILTNIAIAVFLLEETLDPADARPFSLSNRPGWQSLSQFGRTRRGALRGAYLFYSMAFIAYPGLWSYYSQGILGWSPLTMGLSMTMFCVFLVIANVAGLKFAVARLGADATIQLSLLISAAAAVALALSPPDALVLALFPVIALVSIADALLLTSYADTGGAEEQGVLQGQMSALRAAAVVLAPPVLGALMAWTNAPGTPVALPGGMFLLVAAFYLGAWSFFRRALQRE